MRQVRPVKNRAGLFELGPRSAATGLGDTLTLTPLAKALGDKAVMLMPERMKHLAFVFRNLCRVEFTENYPEFPWIGAKEHVATGALKYFGIWNVPPVPVIDVDPKEIKAAKKMLAGFRNPVAVCPTCAKHWTNVRGRPPQFWQPAVDQLLMRYDVIQFGFGDYPLLRGAKRLPFVSLERTAALYHVIGNLVSVDTGDYHLMLAAGGRCAVACPDPQIPGNEKQWNYPDCKRVTYGKLSHPSTMIDAMAKLGLLI